MSEAPPPHQSGSSRPSGSGAPDPAAEVRGAEPPDPDPSETTGLQSGGSVDPGDTPPSEGGTSGLSAPEARLPSRRTNLGIAVGIVVLLVVIALALLVARWT